MKRSYWFTQRAVKRVTVALLLAACARGALAQSHFGTLTGTVTDKGTGQPIANATIVVSGTSYGTRTKANGQYMVLGLPAASYSVKATCVGFGAVEVANVTIAGDVTRQLSFELRRVPNAGASPSCDSGAPMVEQGTLPGQRAGRGDMIAQQVARTELPVRTYTLENLRPTDAAKLLAPYVPRMVDAGVYEAGTGVNAITVRAPTENLAIIDSVLRAYDRPPVTVRLRFQLIAALDSSVHDPAISEIDGTLRGLFRFAGYRLVAEGTTTVSERTQYSMTLTSEGSSYELNGLLGASSVSGATTSQQMTVRLSGLVRGMNMGRGNTSSWTGIISTGLTVPFGQTVVVGGSTGNVGDRSLILAVRPELASSPPRR